MNRIVALTDFSSSADNALQYAAALASKTKTALTIIHVYQIPVTMNDMPVMLISVEELKNNVDERLQKVQQEISQQYSNVNISTEGLIGDVADEVRSWCEENDPLLVIAGTHQSSGAERMLLGSTAAAIVRHLHHPVIAVPQDYTNYTLRHAVLATDLSHMDAFPGERLNRLLTALDLKLRVVHVATEGGRTDISIPSLDSIQPTYEVLHNEDVNQCLLSLQEKPDVDLLILLPHEHNIIERFFFKLHAEPILQKAHKPVMTIRTTD
jgi:nucleotide-binding universal stress UspA family protein